MKHKNVPAALTALSESVHDHEWDVVPREVRRPQPPDNTPPEKAVWPDRGLRSLKGLDPLGGLFTVRDDPRLRGNGRTLYKPVATCRARADFFSVRVLNDWNSLPPEVVSAPTVGSFKSRLDEAWPALFSDPQCIRDGW